MKKKSAVGGLTDMVKENIVKPANRESNYFMKYDKFKNFDNLVNKRAKWFTLLLIKQQLKKYKITKHDDLIKQNYEQDRQLVFTNE
jgi:hypothetical protein